MKRGLNLGFPITIFLVAYFSFTGEARNTPKDKDKPYIVMAEQKNRSWIIAGCGGEIIWNWKPDDSAIPDDHKEWFRNPSEVKPVLSRKSLLITASGGAVALIRIGDKKVLFYGYAGMNPHSAELLPDGNIVSASSTDNQIMIFKVDTIAGTGEAVRRYDVPDAHNVVWDYHRKRLYTASEGNLISFVYNFNRENPELTDREVLYRMENEGSHDLFPDYRGKKLFWTTNERVWIFNPKRCKARELYTITRVKSITDSPEGTIMLKPAESWWSDRLVDGKGETVFRKEGYRIYKARWMLYNPFSYPGS